MTDKPQLHWSALSMYMKCPEQYRRRYVMGERIPPGVALIVGSSVHVTAESNLKSKCLNGGKLLDGDVIEDMARDTLNRKWDEEGVLLEDDEKTKGEKTVRGEAVDKSVRLAREHHGVLAPAITPVDADHIERKWVITIKQADYDLAGTTDVIEPSAIRDFKTGAKSKSQRDADTSDQLTLYALQRFVETGETPDRVYLDYTADLKTGAKAASLVSVRAKADFSVLLARIETCVNAIKAGVFPPADQSHWACDPRYCGYASTCKYFRRIRT